MTDLFEFYRARLDEAEQKAKAASPGPWQVDNETYAEKIYDANNNTPVAGGRWGDEASVFESTEDALHIAYWNPQMVLADIAAKRAIFDEHPTVPQDWATEIAGDCRTCADPAPCRTVRLLAQPYAGHPDFRAEWRIEP